MIDEMNNGNSRQPPGLGVHVTAGEVWLKFTPLTGPRGMLNLEALVAACGDYLLRPDVKAAISAWCRETRIGHALDLFTDDTVRRSDHTG